jgi:hypothetical protein
MSREIEVGDIRANPGEMKLGSLGTIDLLDSTPVKIPAIVLNGKEEGPILYVQGAAHGGEMVGLEVIRRVLREKVTPEELRGGIIGVPVANVLAYQFGRRTTPHDDMNLGSAFPGNPQGSTTERIAHALWNAVSKANVMIDIHGNFPPCTTFLLLNQGAGDEKTREKSKQLAQAFGLTIVYSLPRTATVGTGGPRSMGGLALERGIASFSVEMIDARRLTENSINLSVRGLLNVLKALKMIDGQIEKQPSEYVWGGGWVESGGVVTANRGGVLHITKEPGKKISKDEIIARIFNLWGDELEAVTMPFDGYIRAYTYRTHQALASGDTVAYITKTK